MRESLYLSSHNKPKDGDNMKDTGYLGILNGAVLRKLLRRNRKLRPRRLDREIRENRELVNRLAAACLDLNERLLSLSLSVATLLDLLESTGIVSREEFDAYQASFAVDTSGLKSFDVDG